MPESVRARLRRIASLRLHGCNQAADLLLQARGVGLWDVVAQAERRGSLDAAIQNAETNDLLALIQTLPALRAVAFNGGKAAQLGSRLLGPVADRIAFIPLPSSSPAHAALRFAQKAEMWGELGDWLG